jgi:hypothetical protein
MSTFFSNHLQRLVIGLVWLALLQHSVTALAQTPEILPQGSARLIVLTDMGADPDDEESLVRLLTYANEIDIEALIATTSRHQPDRVYRQFIDARIDAYEQVLPNLRRHASNWPSAQDLRQRIFASTTRYGLQGVGENQDTDASRAIIEIVDRHDPRPVWVSVWGGAKDLAQALWRVRQSRSEDEVRIFVSKLRVYSISDQDDAGPWARQSFPELFWITSIHGFTQYALATWTAISSPLPGADNSLITQDWLLDNIRTRGPLGATYTRPMYISEGDTPSFLNLIPNGLNVPERPNWGGWGGRYEKITDFLGLWSDAQDNVIGVDGRSYQGNHETLWRWRPAYQHDFAHRISWSVTDDYSVANHPPQLVLNDHTGSAPLFLTVCPGDQITLSAEGSSDPDGDDLDISWWIYREATGLWSPAVDLVADGWQAKLSVPSWRHPYKMPLPDDFLLHVILEVSDQDKQPLTRYRRAIVRVPTDGGQRYGLACTAITMTERGDVTRFNGGVVSDRGVMSTSESSISELLNHEGAVTILRELMPALLQKLSGVPAIQGMSLRALQSFEPDLSDALLDQIDSDLEALRLDDESPTT